MTMNMNIDDLLRGTQVGRMQSAGHMQIIPLLGDDDDGYAPPQLLVNTTSYGTVVLRNDGDRPTIVPPGAGWVVRQAAQDHALGGGVLLGAKQQATIATARCIQSSQGGYIEAAKHPMLILPAALRPTALASRRETGYSKLWDPIAAFNASVGATGSGHLEYFLKRFEHELDEFVAQFELIPRQLGAVVLVGGRVVGVERAPSAGFWRALWQPLIRVCYGSLAIQRGLETRRAPHTRVPLQTMATSVRELRASLSAVRFQEQRTTAKIVEQLCGVELRAAQDVDQELDGAVLRTVASPGLAGQVVTAKDGCVGFASPCLAQLRDDHGVNAEASESTEPKVVASEVGAEVETPTASEDAPRRARSTLFDRVHDWLFGA